jgi:hypothetical protein
VFDTCDCIPVLPQNISVHPINWILLGSLYYIFVKKFRRDGDNIGITKEKELFAVIVNLFPKEPRDIYRTIILEEVNVQVKFL